MVNAVRTVTDLQRDWLDPVTSNTDYTSTITELERALFNASATESIADAKYRYHITYFGAGYSNLSLADLERIYLSTLTTVADSDTNQDAEYRAYNGLAPEQPPALGGATNLLTANQASIETDTVGFYGSTYTLEKSTEWFAHGTFSLKCSITGAAYPPVVVASAAGYANGVPVTENTAYTYTVTANPGTLAGTNLTNFRVFLYYYTAAGSVIGSPTTITPQAGNTLFYATHTAPATAAWVVMRVLVNLAAAATGQYFYIDKVGIWKGTGGTWALPGEPIIGVS